MDEFFKKKLAGMPVWAWGLIVVAGVGVGLYFIRKQKSTASTTGTTSAGTVGPSEAALNAASQPSGDFVPPTSGSPVYVVTGGAPPTTAPPTSTTQPTQNLTIRASQAGGGQFQQWDKTHTGIPFWQAPDSNIVAYIPFGGTVPSSGTTTGPVQFGSGIYYQVTYKGIQGYISSNDVAGTGGGQDRVYQPGILGAY